MEIEKSANYKQTKTVQHENLRTLVGNEKKNETIKIRKKKVNHGHNRYNKNCIILVVK